MLDENIFHICYRDCKGIAEYELMATFMMSLVQYHNIIRDGKEPFQTGQLQQL